MPTTAERYRAEYYQQFERLLPPKWFKLLRLEDSGPLYPFIQGLCGILAEARISVESAQDMAIPETSEGFWLSLHMLGIGLERRASETDVQGRQRYRFEFSPARNTREGLLTLLQAYSGLSSPAIRIETGFDKGLYGELRLVVDADQPWQEVRWWWLGKFFGEWAANGLSPKADLDLANLQTLAFPAWDFYSRFPTGPELLKPFWRRPAFLDEKRLVNYTQEFENRTAVTVPAASAWALPTASAWDLPAASSYVLGIVAPLPLVASALNSSPISRNLLGFVCANSWDEDATQLSQIWRDINSAGQPGGAYFYYGDSDGCRRIDLDFEPPAVSFGADPLVVSGRGPWELRLTIDGMVAALPLAGQYWQDAAGSATSEMPILDNGSYYLALDFLLLKSSNFRQLTRIELAIGYEQPEYQIVDGWLVPSADAWEVPDADAWETLGGQALEALNLELPVRTVVLARTVAATIPRRINLGFAFRLALTA